MHRALAPAHLGDVDEPLDAFLQLDEGAVVGDAHDLAADSRAPGPDTPSADLGPRVGHDLLHAERNALAAMIILQHDHFDFVANLHHFGRMLHAAPRHIGDVQQAVDAAEVDESAIVGDVLHRAFEDDALFEHAEGLFLERCALALDHAAARDHHVAARAIEFQDLETTALTDVAIEIARGTDINMRSGQERRHADIYLQAALDLAEDRPLRPQFRSGTLFRARARL